MAAGALLVGGAAILLSTLRAGPQQTRRATWAMTCASRLLLRALGIALTQHGGPRAGPSLVVANHVSWLDVLVLASAGTMLPVAESEIAHQPVIGVLARRAGALFIRGDRLRELPGDVDRMTVLLRQGHRVQVFPEATTRCGTSTTAFHRATFQAAIDAAVVISPVAISYRDQTGNPVSGATFIGDTRLITSVRRMLRAQPTTAVAIWLPVIPAIVATGRAATDRARAAAAAERAIARTLHQHVLRPADHRDHQAATFALPALTCEAATGLDRSSLQPQVAGAGL
jgi:1-acyl-sn-glycerol-3-phosphate acyltransferase